MLHAEHSHHFALYTDYQPPFQTSGFLGIVRNGNQSWKTQKINSVNTSWLPFNWKVVQDASGATPLTLSAFCIGIKKSCLPCHKLKLKTYAQGKAVTNFLDSIWTSPLRVASMVALLAARGHGKSATLGLAIARAIAGGKLNQMSLPI
uniref:Uncharacterized protein n=1 Tax=Triticum urartu TaxID=4572 RepID=A0A8R7Q8N4_TRIUA